MKRPTAIRHLVELAEAASEGLRLRGTDIGWPVEELWVAGELLGFADLIDVGIVVLVLDIPVEELPWLARHPTGEWVGHQLRLGKRPMRWNYRPAARPVWNHELRQLVRFWSAETGCDEEVIDALRSRRFDRLAVVEPSPRQLRERLGDELAASRRHLRGVLDQYWDRQWRQQHKGFDESPEDHLLRAATAVSDMQDALDELGT
ncbi:MAG: DUF7711 family protein [Acidimicrobiales bacterium]